MKARPNDLPPHDTTAERGLIGGILHDSQAFDEVRTKIKPDDFYLVAHQRLYSCIASFLDAGKPCNLVILFDELKRLGWVDEVGGAVYLAECWEAAPTGAEANYYAEIVRDAAKRRRLIHLAGEMQRDAFDGISPADEMAAKFESDLFRISDNSNSNEPELIGNSIQEVFENIGQPPKPGTFIRTGLSKIDGYIGGYCSGKLYIIAARPSAGKSAFVQQTFEHATQNERVSALLFSLEMPKDELSGRSIARTCQVSLNAVTGLTKPTQEDYDRLFAEYRRCKSSLFVDECEHHTAATIGAIARRAVKKHGVKLIGIDYLQLLEHSGERGDNLSTRIGNTTRALKKLARNLKVPVVLLSQLSRDIEKRGGDSEPQLSDLRDSGAIEQDADVVIMLHPQAVLVNGGPPPREQQINAYIRKQRGGPKGTAELMYERAVLTFRDKLNNW